MAQNKASVMGNASASIILQRIVVLISDSQIALDSLNNIFGLNGKVRGSSYLIYHYKFSFNELHRLDS